MASVLQTIFLLVVCAALSKAAITKEQMEELLKMAAACKSKTGPSDADIDALMHHRMPAGQEGLCYAACMNKELGIFRADNSVDTDRIKQLSVNLKERDADKYDKYMAIVDKCAASVPVNADECAMAGSVMECSHIETKTAEIEITAFDFM